MLAIPKCRFVSSLFQSLSPSALRLQKRSASTFLQEVGKLQKPLDPEDTSVSYKTGQLFLHKQFGYRGVILIPWKTKVMENNVSPTVPIQDGEEMIDILCGNVDEPNHIERPAELFYNVLVDSTDSSYVRAALDGVSFLARDSASDLVIFTMPGVDLVHNDDVVPYRITDYDEEEFPPNATITDFLLHHRTKDVEKPPILHEFFSKFFQPSMMRKSLAEPVHSGTRALNKWKRRNGRWLKPEAVFRAENRECGIRVTVIPFYMGSHDGGLGEAEEAEQPRFWWRYILRVENFGTKSLMLKSRSWSLSTQKGTFDKKTEIGLEGRHTVLSPWNPSTQITCYCSLEADTGSIWGHLDFVDAEGKTYDCLIPHFLFKSAKKSKSPKIGEAE